MKVSTENITKAIEQWAQTDLVSKGNALQKGFTTFVLLQGKPKIEQMLSNLKLLADDQGLFEVDTLHDNLVQSLKVMGGIYTIPLINYNFDQQDLEKVFNYIRSNAS